MARFCVVTQDLTEKDRPIEVGLRLEPGSEAVTLLVNELPVAYLDENGLSMCVGLEATSIGRIFALTNKGQIPIRW